MRVTLWGTRGSLANASPETMRYGGNTSCVEVRGEHGDVLVLDAGTGIRRLGRQLAAEERRRIDLLLTHLHMDHIQGLGFFDPLYTEGREVHIWGPPSLTLGLRERLARYLSPPLFPVRIRDLPCQPILHDVSRGGMEINGFTVKADLVAHPGPTVGYRISDGEHVVSYLPDHEPALGVQTFPQAPDWTSGYRIAEGADLLIHDAQYDEHEYSEHVGWGHSSMSQALSFATTAGVKRFVTFHHDPAHDDTALDQIYQDALHSGELPFELIAGVEGATFSLNGDG